MAADEPSSFEVLARLGEGLRLRLLELVRRSPRPVGRDEAAARAGISRKLAAFHLDKLVELGLLQAVSGSPERPRRVGRAPKLYAAGATEVNVSIPRREHGLLAGILVEAVAAGSPAGEAARAARRVAHQRGRELGRAQRPDAGGGAAPLAAPLTVAERALAGLGFEPYRAAPGVVRLRNCPFRPISVQATELVCGINHAYVSGLLDGLEAGAARALLRPEAGECCVEVRAEAV
jgi:predicted ArsR family transcriptional regulator